jgi:hypothetical protein
MKRLDRAEGEVRWLSLMLEQVRDNGQVDYAEVERSTSRVKDLVGSRE